MFIYFFVFSVSTLLLACTEVDKKNKAFIKKLIVIFALVLPILLAACREVGIGTDTKVYAINLANIARNANNFSSYLKDSVFITYKYVPVLDFEIGYNILVYFSMKIFGTVQGLFFVTEGLIVFFLYKGIKKINIDLSISIMFFSFLGLFYGITLNAMRQWIAISILIYGFSYLYNNCTFKFFIYMILACSFHNSAIIGVLIWLLYRFFSESKVIKMPKIRGVNDPDVYKIIFLLLTGIVFLFSIGTIGKILSLFGPTFSRYVRVYLTGKVYFSNMQIIRRLPVIFMLIISWKKMKSFSKITPFLYGMYIMEILSSQLNTLYVQSGRIGYYFSVFNIILFPLIIKIQRKKNRLFIGILLILYVIFIFYYDFVYQGWNEIVPYISCFQ